MTTLNTVLEQTVKRLQLVLNRLQPHGTDNPFLRGVFAPVPTETEVTSFMIEGGIPPHLNGLLTRIGPNPIEVHNPRAYHWFLGDGMVHGLRLEEGQARWYRSRYIGVDSVQKRLGRSILRGKRRGVADVVNTNLVHHAGKLWALVESGPYPVELDADLNSVAHGLFHSNLQLGYTAHPHRDPDSGELFAICYDALSTTSVRYLVLDPAGQVRRNVKIPVQHGPMIHDCAITQSSVLVFDFPVTFSLKPLLRGGGFPYAWNDRHPARIGVMPREGQAIDIRWFAVDPCFSFHACNAFDLPNGDIVLDLVVHDRMFHQAIQGPESDVSGIRLERWTLSADDHKVNRRVISQQPQEFPRMDERLTGKPYRYCYSVSTGERLDHPTENLLLRHDMETGAVTSHHYGTNKFSSEVVFVPKSPDAQEGDGWLLSYVHDLDCGNSQVVILDSNRLEGTPQAVIHLPVRVPLGFHATWVASKV